MRILVGRNWFLTGLCLAVAAAFVYPQAGAEGGWLRSEYTSDAAVALIFLMQGLVLPIEAVRTGLANARLHALVQSWIFLVIPVFAITLDLAAGHWLPEEIRVGFLFLAVLPTTISSAVVFTSLAGGNAAGALVNCTLANVAGVFLTPLWLAVLLEARGDSPPLAPLIGSILMLIVVPFFAGQALRPFARRWADRYEHRYRDASSALILFIVYAAFSDSVRAGAWHGQGWRVAIGAIVGAGVLFGLALVTSAWAAKRLGLPPGDRMAVMMCAPQKTLAAAVPMAKLIFAGSPAVGLILIPVMLYHPLQLLAGGMLISRWRNRVDEKGGAN